jgi:hypothetical protein
MFKGVYAPPGSMSNLEFSKEISISKGKPYSSCVDLNRINSDSFKQVKKLGYNYRQDTCTLICFQNYLINHCGCYHGSYPPPVGSEKYSICVNITQIMCTFQSFVEFFGGKNLIERYCSKECPKECKIVTFYPSISMNEFPSEAYGQLLAQDELIISKFPPGTNITRQLLKENFLTVRMYYRSLDYSRIRESPKISPFNFLSIIGGTASLFLGISLLSIIEVFEILFQVLSVLFQTNKTKRKISTENRLNGII